MTNTEIEQRYRYFVTDDDGVERLTDADGYIAMERRCGFQPKPGCGPFATGGFSSGKRKGRIEFLFDGPATVRDLEGDLTARFNTSEQAYDYTRGNNAHQGRTRFIVEPAAS